MTELEITPSSSSSISAKCRSSDRTLIQLKIRNTTIIAMPTSPVTRDESDAGRRRNASLSGIRDVQRVPHAAHGLDELGLVAVVYLGAQPPD